MTKTLIYFSLALVLLISACKKEYQNKGADILRGYRLTQIIRSQEGNIDDTVVFSYVDEKVTGWVVRGFENNDFKVEITYPDYNTVEFIKSDQDYGIWEIEEKIVYTISNNLVIIEENFNFDGEGYTKMGKRSYQYNNDDNLVEYVFSHFATGSEVPLYRQEFIYNDTLLTVDHRYQYHIDSWLETSNIIYEYDGNVLASSILSSKTNNIWKQYVKDEFNYEGDNVIEINSYQISNDSSLVLNSVINYTYDGNGNIIAWEESISMGNTFFNSYTYEQESGNLSLFNLEYDYGYPDPFYNLEIHLSTASDHVKIR